MIANLFDAIDNMTDLNFVLLLGGLALLGIAVCKYMARRAER